MTHEAVLPKTELTPHGLVEQMRIHGWTWRTGGAVFGLCCGIISPLIGSVLTAIAWLTGPEWHGLSLHLFFVVNGHWHLARANNVPSSGGQLAYKINPRVTVKETVLLGPHQANTSFKFWRFLSDAIVERKVDRVTFAFEYITSWERVDVAGSPRALMMSSQLPVRWTLNKRWAVAVRPEVFWDRDGRWTLARQTVKAITTTLEYRMPYRQTNSILRLEHRYDDSRGSDGGFFRGAEVRGVVGLTPTQHLLIFGVMFTFDR